MAAAGAEEGKGQVMHPAVCGLLHQCCLPMFECCGYRLPILKSVLQLYLHPRMCSLHDHNVFLDNFDLSDVALGPSLSSLHAELCSCAGQAACRG